ncbi:MAG: TylF/MycF/NovP-related O-methyltransferase [Phycisphaerales bacterium]
MKHQHTPPSPTTSLAGTPGGSPTESICVQLITSARESFLINDYQAALEYASKAKSLSASCVEADILRAQCFQNLGDLNSAIQAAREALRHDPNSLQAKSVLDSFPQSQHHESKTTDTHTIRMIRDAQNHTMVGQERLENLVTLINRIAEAQTPGIFVECGVAGGGSLALIACAAHHNQLHNRMIYGFDTFSGMPEPTDLDTAGSIPAQSTGWGQGTCAAPLESVEQVLVNSGISDSVTLIPGRFEDTLPTFTSQLASTNTKIAMLHADGDWYSSTHAIFTHLAPHLSPGALIQIDDYGHWDGCRRATDEYLSKHAPDIALHPIDYTGRWIQWPS